MDQYNDVGEAKATTPGERAVLAAEYLLGNGNGPPFTGQQKIEAAKRFGASRSSTERLLGIHARNQDLFEKVKRGEIKMAEASRAAGFIEYRLDRDVPAAGFFGKGDKFWEASGPIHRYLTGWESRGYTFTNVAPKEAERRVAKIEKILAMLEKAKEDLVGRADRARLTVTK